MLFGPASRGPILPTRYNDLARIIRNQQRAQMNQGIRNIGKGLLKHGVMGAVGAVAGNYMFPSHTTPDTAKVTEPNATGTKRKRLGISDTGDKKGPNKRLRFDPDDLPGEPGSSESTPREPSDKMATKKRKNSSNNEGSHGDEVPVMPIFGPLSKVVPNFYTVNLPHEESLVFSTNTFAKTNSTPLCRIRLNSIYDPIVGAASNVQPQGRDLWASHFKYYRVLHAKITCTVISIHPPSTAGNDPLWGNFNFGYELLDQDQTLCGDLESFLVAKHCKRSMLGPAVVGQVYNGTSADEYVLSNSQQTFVYNYSPGEWNYHVREQGSEERWTPILQNPSIDHDLAVRLFHLSASAPRTQVNNLALLIGIQYTVQFMEEKEEAYKIRDATVATYTGPGEDAADD